MKSTRTTLVRCPLNLARLVAAFAVGSIAPGYAADLPLVSRWQRFEHQFRSDIAYTNPGDVSLRVEIRSPQGETQSVPGFWDGGKIWRVRMLPGRAGRWTFHAICSDTNNAGLHGQTGEFLCTAGARGNRWLEHGRVQVAREGTGFEFADRTPMFLVTELAWDTVRRKSAKEVETLARQLADQKFNALAWTIFPGKDERGETALSPGVSGGPNLAFWHRLEPKVEAITRAGLVNVIAPAWELRGFGEEAPETAMAALLQQAVARWHANPTLWLLAAESSSGEKIGRWRRLGRQVFADGAAGPVIFLPGETQWLWEEFRIEPWVSALGFKSAHLTTDDALQWFLTGPLAIEHRQTPLRPVLDLIPMKASRNARSLLWWGLLLNPPAGVCLQPAGDAGQSLELTPALVAAEFMKAIEFQKLRPAPRLLATQPGRDSPRQFIAVAASATQDLVVAYVPASRTIQLLPAAIPGRHADSWFNPRTGEYSPATGVMSATSVAYQTPGEGDWVLVVHATK